MAELAAGAVALMTLIVMFAVGRRAGARRHAGAVTVSMVFDDEGASRELADGRRETVRWAEVIEVEVVCTPVRTADDAVAFVVLSGRDATSGCLVPLGVGHDDRLLRRLAALPGFDLGPWAEARRRPAPARTVVWREPAAGG